MAEKEAPGICLHTQKTTVLGKTYSGTLKSAECCQFQGKIWDSKLQLMFINFGKFQLLLAQ